MMAVATPRARSRDAGHEPLRIEPPAGQARRPRLSWIALGLVVVIASALLGTIMLARVADRTPVLALSQPLEWGEPLTPDHLRVVEVAVDGDVHLVPAGEEGGLLGLAAAGPIPAGTLLTRDHFVDGPVLPDGWRVVGMALQPGEYPTVSLRAGDRVTIVRTPDATAGAGEDARVLVESAEVFAVEPLSEATRTLMVSIAVPAHVAPTVASASAQGRARLVLEAPR